jgi:hypothetical protein
VGRWIGERFAAVVTWLRELRETVPVLYWLLIGLLALLALVAVVLLARRARRYFFLRAAARHDKARERRAWLSQLFREEGLARAAAGDFTEAIRCLFLSLVYRFDEEGRVGFDRSYTNREYLSLFAGQPLAGDELKVFVDTLDDHWYGQRPTDRGRYEECLALYEDLSRAG